MRLWTRMCVAYGLGAALPLAVYLGFYRPALARTDAVRGGLERERGEVERLTKRYEEASQRVLGAKPPRPPTPGERLDQAAAVAVPGASVRVTERAEPAMVVEIRGDALATVSWLEALHALPNAPEVRAVSLAPAAEGTGLLGLLGRVRLEAEE